MSHSPTSASKRLSTGLAVGWDGRGSAPAAGTALRALARRTPLPVTARRQPWLAHGDPINTATNKPAKAIKVGNEPWAIAITPDGTTAYVSNYLSGTVTPTSTATNKPGKAKGRARSGSARDRDHPEREDRLRRQPRRELRQADQHGHRQGRQKDPRRGDPRLHRDHPGRQDRLRRQPGLGHRDPDPHRHQHRRHGDPGRARRRRAPVGFQNSATGLDLGIYAARSYSLMRPPRTGWRLIRCPERSAIGRSGRGGRSARLRSGLCRAKTRSPSLACCFALARLLCGIR